ncbi:MAG: hypothetical protein HY961_09265, partial [Ignavibacteriae bacterium]|nr:hypothetical protein [Ignavibacteriota bacterium]
MKPAALLLPILFLTSTSLAQPASVTFRVNMKVKMLEGSFKPDSGDIVRVAGSFNDWGNSRDTLTDVAPIDSVYQKTVSLATGPIEYKFVKTMRGGLDWEGGANRTYTVSHSGGMVPIDWFDRDSMVSTFISGTVTFRVNMAAFETMQWFLPHLDSLSVRGSMSDFVRLVAEPLPPFYRGAFTYSGLGLELPYRYHIRMDSASAVARFPGWLQNRDFFEYEYAYARGGGNRMRTNLGVQSEYYADIHPDYVMRNSSDTCRVTLRVNMAPAARHSVPFDPIADTLEIAFQDFLWSSAQMKNQGVFASRLRMSRQTPFDSVWSASFRVKGKAHGGLMYVYRYTKANQSYVEEGGGVGIYRPNRVRLIQLLSPNVFPSGYVAPIDTWQKDPPMPVESLPFPLSVGEKEKPEVPAETRLHQNYPNPFNPTA